MAEYCTHCGLFLTSNSFLIGSEELCQDCALNQALMPKLDAAQELRIEAGFVPQSSLAQEPVYGYDLSLDPLDL